MKILVTAGNTLALIDRVRCITNIFTGRTGASIALEANSRGHAATLLTSHPEAIQQRSGRLPESGERWSVQPYQTFDDLHAWMSSLIPHEGFDAIVHCAAVSDYLCAGVFSLDPATRFDPATGTWSGSPPTLIDRAAGKVKSDEQELWIRTVRAPKLVDQIRSIWGFTGVLVKFKLEVGLSDEQLLAIAERSRVHSEADLMVANTLEGAGEYAFLGSVDKGYRRVRRPDLARALLEAIEQLVPKGDSLRGACP